MYKKTPITYNLDRTPARCLCARAVSNEARNDTHPGRQLLAVSVRQTDRQRQRIRERQWETKRDRDKDKDGDKLYA